MSLRRDYKHIWPGLVYLMTRAPRTAQSLAVLLGCKADTVRDNLKLMEGEGLVKRERRRGPESDLWTWVPGEKGLAFSAGPELTKLMETP